MLRLAEIHSNHFRIVKCVLCDLDGTLTQQSILPARTLSGLEMLSTAGYHPIIVTGRSAGWCDMMARLWPVFGVVGENGAFYFRYNREEHQMVSYFAETKAQREVNRERLENLFQFISTKYPFLRPSGDVSFRVSDYAIDCAEDVESLKPDIVADIMLELGKAGATAKLSSIHINFWFGKFDKLSMALALLRRELNLNRDVASKVGLYIGDSPNDEQMFGFFEYSVGVQNVMAYADQIENMPRYVCSDEESEGFVEVVNKLVSEI